MRRPRLSLWAFVWPTAALGIFAGLQIWRISVLDDLRGPHLAAPAVYEELGPWIMQARGVRPGVTTSFRPSQALLRVRQDQPEILVGLVGRGIALALIGWPLALVISASASFAIRRLPRSMVMRHRVRTSSRALILATPWGLPLGLLLGAGTWYVGFDRSGAERPMIDALVPTPVQTTALLFTWSILMAFISTQFLMRAAAIEGPTCLRCAYPRAGLTAYRCPECGLLFAEVAGLAPSLRACHASVGKWTAAFALVLAGGWIAALLIHPASRDWVRLRPQWAERQRFGSACAWLSVGNSFSQQVECRYGTVMFRAEPASTDGQTSGDDWNIHWDFAPLASSPVVAASGSVSVVVPTPVTSARTSIAPIALPFGDVSIVRVQGMPDTLIVQGNSLIFEPAPSPSGVYWGFPRSR